MTAPTEATIIAAQRFAMHAIMCEACSADGTLVCEAGRELLDEFYASLNPNDVSYDA